MATDIIIWGETYDLSVTAKDAAGAAVALDGTWAAACRVCASLGGTLVLEPAMTITGGAAVASIDTGDEPWAPGTYIYDIRLTDPDGNDYWCEPVTLILKLRNTPASVPAP